jgi:ATP-dependent DNA helicase RecQ
MLLHYFGETYDKDNCHNCDNCLHPKTKIEAQQQLLIVLKAVQLLKEDFRSDYVIDFVCGHATNDIVAHHHDQLEEFGEGEDEDTKLWNPVVRQAIIAGFLEKDVENYGLLKLTAAGKRFIKNPEPFMIVEDHEFTEDDTDDDGEAQGSALDPMLYAMLKDLRQKVARQKQLPPYVIFMDASLEQMATVYPVTLEELQNIQGVGAGKARKFGREFVELIKKHCEENEIERPEDLRVRTVAKKSMLKVKIIQSIDRQVALDTIANAQGLDFNELLNEIEAIVYSGTKLNIDYFIDDVMDEEHVDDIFDYFAESDTDDLDTAQDELGPEYSEEEIRLIRIKFLSDMAN